MSYDKVGVLSGKQDKDYYNFKILLGVREPR